MNTLQINQVLSQMRALAAQAGQSPLAPPDAAKEPGFADVLKNAVGEVNHSQKVAAQKQAAFLSGEDIPLTDVMVSLQKSRVSFEAVKQVRNQLLQAYQEISRMQV